MSDKLIWTKRYGEAEDIRFFDELCERFSKVSDTVCLCKREEADNTEGSKDPLQCIEHSITRIPLEHRIMRSKDFIKDAKHYSQTHHVSCDIYRGASMVSVWFYFSADILTGDRKTGLVDLLEKADEISGVPHPNGMSEWCEYAVVLYFITHRSFTNGRELHTV